MCADSIKPVSAFQFPQTGYFSGYFASPSRVEARESEVSSQSPVFSGRNSVSRSRETNRERAGKEQGAFQAATKVIGRKKLSDIELDDAAKPAYAHNVLTTIEGRARTRAALEDLGASNVKRD